MLCRGGEWIWRWWFDGLGWNKSELQNGTAYCARGRWNAMTYRDTILQTIVVLFMRNNGLTLLQQETARPHTARTTTDFLCKQAVNVMPWPSVSQISIRSSIYGMSLDDASVIVQSSLRIFNNLRLLSIRNGRVFHRTLCDVTFIRCDLVVTQSLMQ